MGVVFFRFHYWLLKNLPCGSAKSFGFVDKHANPCPNDDINSNLHSHLDQINNTNTCTHLNVYANFHNNLYQYGNADIYLVNNFHNDRHPLNRHIFTDHYFHRDKYFNLRSHDDC